MDRVAEPTSNSSVIDAPGGRAAPPILIVGCGRSLRRDDQLGLLVAAKLAQHPPIGAKIRQTEAPGADLLDIDAGVELLIIVDAFRARRPEDIGRCLRMVYCGEGPAGDESNAPADIDDGVSPDAAPRFAQLLARDGADQRHAPGHTLGVAAALELCAALGALPPNVWIYAVGGAAFDYGESMTPAVAAAANELGRKVCADINACCESL